MAEFSSYGVAGARVDRIARTAGCNKNLIYIYFENKETLFTTILEKHLPRVYEELAFAAEDLCGYAERVDFAMAQPDLMRLLAWSSLERSARTPAARVESRAEKIVALAQAQAAGQVGTAFSPDVLLTAIMTLAAAWSAANAFAPPVVPDAAARRAELRTSVAEAVRLIAQADAPGA
jgi:AcrR family transcriptional regulator